MPELSEITVLARQMKSAICTATRAAGTQVFSWSPSWASW